MNQGAIPWDSPRVHSPPAYVRILKWFWKRKIAALSMLTIMGLYLCGIFAEWLAPHDPNFQDFTASYEAPSWDHWLGTDSLGRDYFSRVLFALRTTIGITAATVLVGSGFAAIFFALLSGYKGGWIDTAVMRIGEISALFPELMFMILIAATVGPRYHGFINDVVAWEGTRIVLQAAPLIILGIVAAAVLAVYSARKGWGAPLLVGWLLILILFCTLAISWLVRIPGFADFFLIFLVLLPFSWFGATRLLRSQVLSLREEEFVFAAKAMGASDTRIMMQHLLPNIMGLVVYLFSAGFAAVAASEVALTWLGLGVQPPNASFGTLIADAGFIRTLKAYPHLLLIPGFIVSMFIYGYNLIGIALDKDVTLKNR